MQSLKLMQNKFNSNQNERTYADKVSISVQTHVAALRVQFRIPMGRSLGHLALDVIEVTGEREVQQRVIMADAAAVI